MNDMCGIGLNYKIRRKPEGPWGMSRSDLSWHVLVGLLFRSSCTLRSSPSKEKQFDKPEAKQKDPCEI